MHVALILARQGADDVTLMGALLHDVVEDCDDWDVERVRDGFGPEVSEIVADLTEDKSKSWAERKQAAIDHVPHMSARAAHVKAADKLHNLSCLVAELTAATDPGEVWRHFRGGPARTLRTAEELVLALSGRVEAPLVERLQAVIVQLRTFTP